MSPFSLDFLSTRRSNLQSFLQSVTPIVPSKPLPRSNMDDQSRTWNSNGDEYFTLGDLWDCYEEWSAYGVGAPICLKDQDNETVVQYYAPYLSAIQIYTIRSPSTLRNSSGDEVDGTDFEVESWSDASDSTDKFSRSLSNNSISADSCVEVEGSRDRLGYLYFQYSETCTPYWRIPFADKIFELSQNYPGLATLKSTDLSAASWMAVVWYPIYHVPMKRIVKNVSASFLTYHTLSSSFQDAVEENFDSGIRLSPFGLAAYRMQNDIWINSDAQDYEKLNDLQNAADSWLKQLSFHHHDYNFFTSHNNIELGFSF
ncbi:uncharacterized protein LOC107780077 [Nicotiana tabacum]|uniref:Uncharacterized protein LOC107780077 n=1 Tax=Nicotiana tabacum TaxID=4097 RepID=A0A1S3YVC1_TOBAC|nr:uncharacterized protein LOC104088094 [Nicotiana tomentosiformis]XP_016456083.1 PREDICTED: uncharacterized protein LOC107780077 [Nicotiana tabacum]